MSAIIRDARMEDIPEMVLLLEQLFTIETDFTINVEKHRQGLEMMIESSGSSRCVKVADVKGCVIGMGTAQLMVSTAEGAWVALVEDIVVEAQWRGRGIGRKLVSVLETWAWSRGAARMQLLADRTNFSALDFYHHIGWRPTRMICLHRKEPEGHRSMSGSG
jgi:GNAT superfamily N-acetyltransferase